MRIATTGGFGNITWEMDPEMSEQYHKTITKLKEVAGEEMARNFEHAFIEQVQGIFRVAALNAKSAIYMPHLALIMLSTLVNGMGMASYAINDLLESQRHEDE